MDQHPIPQDVTGFQFKLIGTMTVKQFGYVACGVVLAVVLYYSPLNSAIGVLAKVFLIPILAASGFIVSFVPIEGRPIDVMATNFFKALFSPNQYIYHRQGKKLSFSTITTAKPQVAKKTGDSTTQASTQPTNMRQLSQKEEKLRAFLNSSQSQVKNDLDKKEVAFLKTLSIPDISPTTPSTAQASTIPSPISPPASSPSAIPTTQSVPTTPAAETQAPRQAPLPAPKPMATPPSPAPMQPTPAPNENEKQKLDQKETQLEQQLTQAKQEEAITKEVPTQQVAHKKVADLSAQIDAIHAQKAQLEKELAQLKTQLVAQKVTPTITTKPVPAPVVAQPAQDPQHVRTIPQAVTKKAGLPHVSDTPNVVVGIVKDPRGNVISNILVEVKDKNGNPVRAFKTNPLGQFASATPLSAGIYTIELEDPKKQHHFDVIQINANNQILLPIEIISHDAREDLRKQLFAN